MKKVLAGILAIWFALSLCACGETEAIPTDEQTPLFTQTENTTATSAETTAADTVATEATIAENTAPTHLHSYTGATCTEPATCLCGATQGSANGHSFSDGLCETCGTAESKPQQASTVWVPTNGGKKYHAKASCSNMKDPEEVAKTEAEERGFEPCKKCF